MQDFDRNPQHLMGACGKFHNPFCRSLTGRRDEMNFNEKLPIDGKGILAVILAAAATALCAVIDLLLQGENASNDGE